MILTRDGRRAYVGCSDGALRCWDLTNPADSWEIAGAHARCIVSLSLTSDEKLLASAGGDDLRIRLWDVATGELVRTFEGHKAPVSRVAISGDGRRLVSASLDQNAISWDPATGKVRATFTTHGCKLWAAGFCPQTGHVATGGEDGVVRVWDPMNGAEVRKLPAVEGTVEDLAFSPTGSDLLVGAKTISVVDPLTGGLKWNSNGVGAFRVAVPLGGAFSRFATFDRGELRLWQR